MAERKVEPRLQELWNKGVSVYSFSKLSSIEECLYGAYLTYIKRQKGKDSCYSLAGSATHDCLESIVLGFATEEDLLPTIQTTLDELEILGLPFPKDRKGGDTIRDGWVADMEYFCKHYVKPKGNFETEKFFLYRTDEEIYMQGYIDLIHLHKDGTISIYDYKTSSMFTKEELPHKARQLVIYALAEEQEGREVKKVAWIMLKFSKVDFVGKKTSRSVKESEISKVIENKKIVEELEKHIIYKLEQLGYDEVDIECIMVKAKEENEIPKEVADQFKVRPYVMEYEITEEVKQECIDWINKIAKMWESLDKDKKFNYQPRKLTRMQKNGKEVDDSFFCNNLCNHRQTCEYIKEYNAMNAEKYKKKKDGIDIDDEDLFG